MNEILCFITFDTICSSKFASNYVDCSLPTPRSNDVLIDIHEPSIFGFGIPSFEYGYPIPKLRKVWVLQLGLIGQ
jgi:hypothetical protein